MLIWFLFQLKSIPLKIHKLLRMTYNEICECCLVLGALRPSKWLVKEKGVASPKYTAITKRRSEEWNLERPAPLSLWRPVIVNIRIINASTLEQKYLGCRDLSCTEIFRNSLREKYPWLNIYIYLPLTKSKNEH